ncbi:uncharacterized protein LOC106873963 [Octopus bimaculoides]|nr:uncharacterized protein LOC106873963 [Octopus bimaculoides]
MGCLASGILGTILNLLRISLQENSEFLVYNRLLPITHIMASFLSLLLFEFHTTAEHNIWIAAVQLVSLLGNFTKRKGNEE